MQSDARHFEIDIGEVEIGEDQEIGQLSKAKKRAYKQNRALIDVALERGDEMLEARLRERDEKLIEAIVSRLRPFFTAIPACYPAELAQQVRAQPVPAVTEPSETLSDSVYKEWPQHQATSGYLPDHERQRQHQIAVTTLPSNGILGSNGSYMPIRRTRRKKAAPDLLSTASANGTEEAVRPSHDVGDTGYEDLDQSAVSARSLSRRRGLAPLRLPMGEGKTPR